MDNGLEKKRILIVNNDFEETEDIKSWLDRDMRIPWSYMHCISVQEALPRINNVDLIILKPEMDGTSSPLEVFEDIEGMVIEIPIIVLANTRTDEHGLSTLVMEKGAADIVIRGKFERLVDAIEFALIRQKITSDTKKASDKTIKNNKSKAAEALQTNKNARKEDSKESAIKLQESNDLRKKDKEESRQMLSLFMGEYSISSRSTES